MSETPKLLFFPGSTIGNFTIPEAQALLSRLGRLSKTVGLVIGVDLRKDVDRLIRAYDDAEGVTAAFNKNLLTRMSRELGATFDLDEFAHEARWNEAQSRIEMLLVSRRRQTVAVAGHRFGFADRETIHTENSHKFSIEGFQALAADAGLTSADVWTDSEAQFSVHVPVPNRAAQVQSEARSSHPRWRSSRVFCCASERRARARSLNLPQLKLRLSATQTSSRAPSTPKPRLRRRRMKVGLLMCSPP